MAKDDLVPVEGVVVEVNAGGLFQVSTEQGTITAKISGRLRHHKIKIVLGDKVTVGVSPYDSGRGLIIKRN